MLPKIYCNQINGVKTHIILLFAYRGEKEFQKLHAYSQKKSMESKSAETMGEHYLSKDDFFSPA